MLIFFGTEYPSPCHNDSKVPLVEQVGGVITVSLASIGQLGSEMIDGQQ